jgi:hypothetical protein
MKTIELSPAEIKIIDEAVTTYAAHLAVDAQGNPEPQAEEYAIAIELLAKIILLRRS